MKLAGELREVEEGVRDVSDAVVRVLYYYRNEFPLGVHGVEVRKITVLDYEGMKQVAAMLASGFMSEDETLSVLVTRNPVAVRKLIERAGGMRAYAVYLARMNEGLV